jgi:hypothetical protein
MLEPNDQPEVLRTNAKLLVRVAAMQSSLLSLRLTYRRRKVRYA